MVAERRLLGTGGYIEKGQTVEEPGRPFHFNIRRVVYEKIEPEQKLPYSI